MIGSTAVGFLFAVLSTPVLGDLGKSVLYPEGLHDPLIGLDNLYVPGGSYYGVDVPQTCKDHASGLSCNVDTLQAVEITYDDCEQPWTVCRCDDANLDLNTVLVRFGQVPVGLRSYVGQVLATGTDNPNAYNAGGFVAINGDCDVSVFLHESSHSLDQGVSTGSAFSNAVAQSSCVPDGYADTSLVEDFAQVSVLHTYQKLVGNLDRDASCLQPQLDVMNNDPRLTDDLFTQRCYPNVRPSFKTIAKSAKFAINVTSTISKPAARPQSSPEAVKAFQKKFGHSRDALAAAHTHPVNNTKATPKHEDPTTRIKYVPHPPSPQAS